ncbi:MAG: bifunctional diaminohydroxyphosphoribosylaminopyrimidine deaminase/5-amino-6-(5-phosphoribosylamino)uracil reductase RibD [Vampirovibrionales bacterium]|nr:bifunctional diaminohydroxyphosphoribosylaminopyrimidine deaminase/5-amino-6-(5-phosphoribosylamino)uracil reductase RibD [Vampirovibrionales bacterium]
MPVQWHASIPSAELASEDCDVFWMRRCLQLAQRGLGGASPNPLVGCVIVNKAGKLIGEGFHAKAGEAHAEVDALRQVCEAQELGYLGADDLKGATVYVNLEPCCHTGKTGPCTDALKEAGIGTVVCGTLDPNPLVSGQGRDALQRAQISVRVGVLEEECAELNCVFFHAMTTRKPYVTLKLAATLDGRLGPRQSAWMTSDMARQEVHQLRSYSDAILTTANTVFSDNPRLTVREGLVGKNPNVRQPLRVVLDRHNRLEAMPHCHVLDTAEAPTLRVVGSGVMVSHIDDAFLVVADTGTGLDLTQLMTGLCERGVTSVWVEAGGTLAGSLLDAQLVNRLKLYTPPLILGDTSTPPMISGRLCGNLSQAIGWNVLNRYTLENTSVLDATPIYPA